MVTLFTTTKPFRGLTATHQYNALGSWAQIKPPPTVVVFGAEYGTGEACQKLNLNHIPTIPTDQDGMPALNFMFAVAQEFTDTEFMCYVNADIIILNGLVEATRQIDEKFPGGFLGVCRRWDINLDEPLNFGRDWREVIESRMQDGGELYTPCSSDLFLFKKPLRWHLPPLVAGRSKWDNWMLWAACEHGTPVVDMTEAATVAHSRHGYGSDGTGAKRASSQQNEAIAAGKTYCMKHVSKAGNLWALVDGEIRKV